jgi:hypothetical protein
MTELKIDGKIVRSERDKVERVLKSAMKGRAQAVRWVNERLRNVDGKVGRHNQTLVLYQLIWDDLSKACRAGFAQRGQTIAEQMINAHTISDMIVEAVGETILKVCNGSVGLQAIRAYAITASKNRFLGHLKSPAERRVSSYPRSPIGVEDLHDEIRVTHTRSVLETIVEKEVESARIRSLREDCLPLLEQKLTDKQYDQWVQDQKRPDGIGVGAWSHLRRLLRNMIRGGK